MTRMLQDLPNELHALIISHMDKPSASNYSLASHRFTHIAQNHIFEIVELRIRSGDDLSRDELATPQRFLSLLSSSPRICSLVKSLTVRTQLLVSPLYRDSQDIFLPRCFSLLQNLKNFRIFDMGRICWQDDAMAPINKALQKAFQAQNFVSLSITNVLQFPISLLEHLTELQQLSLNFVKFRTQEDVGFWKDYLDPPHGKPCTLKILNLRYRSGELNFFVTWLKRPLCPINISHLQRLSIAFLPTRDVMNRMDEDNIRSILDLCASSLEILCWSPRAVYAPVTINMGILSRLRVLRLYIPTRFSGSCDLHNVHLWLSDILSSSTLSDHLEELSIKMATAPLIRAACGSDSAAWASIGSLFSTSRTISRIRSLVFFIVLPRRSRLPPKETDVDICKFMNDSFPTLCERGILRVQFTEGELSHLSDLVKAKMHGFDTYKFYCIEWRGFLAGEDIGFPSNIY